MRHMTWLTAVTTATQAPYDLLRIWAIRAALCALALALLALPLLWRALRSRSWRVTRYAAILADTLALIAVTIYASQAWVSYQWFIVHQLPPSYPSRDVYQAYTHALNEALTQYQLGGWTIIGLTAAILIFGTVVALRT